MNRLRAARVVRIEHLRVLIAATKLCSERLEDLPPLVETWSIGQVVLGWLNCREDESAAIQIHEKGVNLSHERLEVLTFMGVDQLDVALREISEAISMLHGAV